ncbi:MAG TPA: DMT family transporter [Stellaceae bacterium]|nr:DMT family transporter [Stellaceae bacterium]
MTQQIRGMLSVAFGVSIFSLQDAIVKGLSDTYPVHEIVVLRSCVALPILVAVVLLLDARALKIRRTGLHLLRGLALYLSYTAYYLGLARLPIAESVALYFTAPFFVASLSLPMLGERVSLRSWASIIVGFGGVLVVARPSTALFEPAVLLPIVSALAYAISAVLTRRLGTTESGGALAISATLVYIVAGGATALGLSGIEVAGDAHRSVRFLLMPWSWPGAADALLLAACGLIAAGGFFFLAQGYRLAEANRAAPFEYAALPWGILWGYLFFANLPDVATLVGAVVIIGAGLYTLQRQPEPPASTLRAAEPARPD